VRGAKWLMAPPASRPPTAAKAKAAPCAILTAFLSLQT
jgi:hypothetical protein